MWKLASAVGQSLGKRQLFLVLSFFLTFLFSLDFWFESSWIRLGMILVLALVSAVSTFLILRLRWEFRSLAYLALPVVLILSTSFVQYLYPHTLLWFKLLFWTTFFLLFYITLLALNIFKVCEERGEVPLLRPAETTLFLVVVTTAFFGFSAILKGSSYLGLQLGSIITLTLLQSLALFTLVRRPWSKLILITSFLVSWVCLSVFLGSSFWPLKSFFRGLVVSASYYTALSLARDYLAHRLCHRLVWEYSLLILALVTVIFVFNPPI